jgi:hypothetical protein
VTAKRSTLPSPELTGLPSLEGHIEPALSGRATSRLRGGIVAVRVTGSWLVRSKTTSDPIPATTIDFAPNCLQTGPVRVLPGALRSQPVLIRAEMAGAGFEPAKAEPTDLQSVPFDRSGIPPKGRPV